MNQNTIVTKLSFRKILDISFWNTLLASLNNLNILRRLGWAYLTPGSSRKLPQLIGTPRRIQTNLVSSLRGSRISIRSAIQAYRLLSKIKKLNLEKLKIYNFLFHIFIFKMFLGSWAFAFELKAESEVGWLAEAGPIQF